MSYLMLLWSSLYLLEFGSSCRLCGLVSLPISCLAVTIYATSGGSSNLRSFSPLFHSAITSSPSGVWGRAITFFNPYRMDNLALNPHGMDDFSLGSCDGQILPPD